MLVFCQYVFYKICRCFSSFCFVVSGRVLFVGRIFYVHWRLVNFLPCRLIIFFEYLVEVKGSGQIKVLVNEVGQYKEVVGFDCPSVWKCLRWCPLVSVHLESWLKAAWREALWGEEAFLDFNLRCFTFSLCWQVLITFLIVFNEVLIFLVGDNEGKDKTYDYYGTEKSYVKLYVYVQIGFKCITVTL